MNSLYSARITAYLRRADGAATHYRRGRNYENLLSYLMSSIPGCEVERNSLNHYGTEEADLSVSNMRLREGLPLLPDVGGHGIPQGRGVERQVIRHPVHVILHGGGGACRGGSGHRKAAMSPPVLKGSGGRWRGERSR